MSMLPGFRCSRCTKAMDKVDDHSWICVTCKVNEYWFGADHDDAWINELLGREANTPEIYDGEAAL